MRNKQFRRFYILSLACMAAASAYPLYMGASVSLNMLHSGAVPMESYPKYVIPYTPIAVAVIFGVVLIPLFQRLLKKRGFLGAALLSTGIFFVTERLLETNILVQTTELVPLESWQMSLCYVPPAQYQTRTWLAVDVLLGGYSPAFKFHFYIISIVLILSLLNSVYGFAGMLRSGDTARKTALTIQTAASLAFLGMCIWACFTSFYRTGEITVSPASAVLMAAFFALMGITMGAFAGSFALGKAGTVSILLPAVIAGATALAMYVGEMILLSGNLYRFGSGFFFDALGSLVLAPVDLLVILLSGSVTAALCAAANRKDPAKG